MRAYLPVGWSRLADLQASGELPGPHVAFRVDPVWCRDAPEVDEEEWEYEAQVLAADAVPAGGGVVLAVEVDQQSVPAVDGRVTLPEAVSRRQLAAVLTEDLRWYGVQEIAELLTRHGADPG